jgi:hypothetical protein
MRQTKTRQVREKELQNLMSTVAGRAELENLAAHYNNGGRARPEKASVITWILVHEREKGLVVD